MKRAIGGLAATPMVSHFTRASRGATAFENLISILRAGHIRGGTRMVRGDEAAVCMFDVPIAELRPILARENRRRYEPFGVAIDRRYAFRMGARPAIYLPWREGCEVIAPGEHWRLVATEVDRRPPIDWTYEREWRIKGDLRLEPRMCAALVESWRDVDEIYDRFAGHPPCAGVIPLKELFGTAA